MKTLFVDCVIVFAMLGMQGYGQQKSLPSPTIASVLDQQLTFVENDFISAAEAMPEEKYSFAPSSGEFKDVRSFALQ